MLYMVMGETCFLKKLAILINMDAPHNIIALYLVLPCTGGFIIWFCDASNDVTNKA